MIICNGDYIQDLFKLDTISMAKLPGYTVDKLNMLKFLSTTVFNTSITPENVYVIQDSNKEGMEAKMKEFLDRVTAASKENNRRIYPFVYYSGHGVTLMQDG